MKTLLVAAVIGTLSFAGCEAGQSPVNPPPSSGATAAPPTASVDAEPTPTDETTAEPSTPRVVLAPGQAGPFTIGMTSEQALKEGLVREPGDHECGLTPVGSYRGLSVQFAESEDGGDVLYGVLVKDDEPKTTEGVGVGDSLAKLKNAYGTRLKPSTGEFGETRYVVTEGNKAIGFTEGEGDAAGKIFAIDVFQADSPGIWDGC